MSKIIKIIVIFILIFIVDAFINQKYLITTKYELTSNKVSKNYTFAQISDYHSSTKENEQIFNILEEENPDFIILSGDILNSVNIDSTVDFAKKLTEYSTVIYVRGNHEDDYESYQEFLQALDEIGVITVGNENYEIGELNFIGIEDFSGANLTEDSRFKQVYSDYISNYTSAVSEDKYNILLAHRPKFLESYADLGVDLVFSGHAHGGQWQIPFTDIGFYAPDDGFMTNNVHGVKSLNETTQIISSGTSNPYEPFIPRLFNRKEVVIVDLKSAN